MLLDCESELDRVENIFVEYHSAVAQPQQPSQLLGYWKGLVSVITFSRQGSAAVNLCCTGRLKRDLICN